MTKPLISPKMAVEVLNRAFAADSKAVRTIFACRAPCNQQLADDPTIQVAAYDLVPGSKFSLAAIGLLNGIFGIRDDGMGYLAASYEVVCRVHGTIDEDRSDKVGDPCPIDGCEETLGLGELVKFMETP